MYTEECLCRTFTDSLINNISLENNLQKYSLKNVALILGISIFILLALVTADSSIPTTMQNRFCPLDRYVYTSIYMYKLSGCNSTDAGNTCMQIKIYCFSKRGHVLIPVHGI